MGKLSGLKEGLEKAAKALDMSQAARMQRAAEQGFDTGKVYYRGQLKPFEEDKIKNITWFTDSPEYADAYTISPTMEEAFSGENIIKAYLNKDKRFDFGYRTLKTDVKKSDVYERVQGGILEAYDRGLISKDKAKLLYKEADEKIKASGNDYKKVYEWYNEDPEIFRIIKESGFDHVTTKEGFADSYNAIGMLYPERMRSVNAAFDPAQKESSNLLAQYAPLAIGAGAAGLALSPQESQAAVAQQLASQPVSNAVADIWQRNLNPVGLNERGVPVTGQMRSTPHPLLMQVADKLRMVDTPIGPVFGGAADYLDKLGAGENVDYWDRLGAALDVIP